jgi:hypothetical protein
MAQYARPTQDVTAWASGTFASIDESVADDGDYVSSETSPSSDPYVVKLGTITDPASSTGHILRYRYRKSAAGAPATDLTVQLRQDYVNEGSPGTLIEAWSHTGISENFTTQEKTLGATETDSITDYSSLYVRFVADEQ